MSKAEQNNYFNILNSIDVSDKIEKKNGLSYLSWAYAWTEVKKLYPNANYKIYETQEGRIYWHDGKTAWVKTGVTIEEVEHIEYLPIMDYRNKSIPINNVTSFDVNKAIQRSLTKSLARHGLGLYIYAGEDLPESPKTPAQVLGELADEDMKSVFKEANRNTFDKLKEGLELCESEEEMRKFTDFNKKDFSKLEKWEPELYKELKEIYRGLRENFESE